MYGVFVVLGSGQAVQQDTSSVPVSNLPRMCVVNCCDHYFCHTGSV